MTNVTMKATDQLHISAVKADSLQPGEEFEVSNALADDLIARGLPVERVKAKAEPAAPAAKVEPAPANKAAKPRAKKRGR